MDPTNFLNKPVKYLHHYRYLQDGIIENVEYREIEDDYLYWIRDDKTRELYPCLIYQWMSKTANEK